jgi:hypothetical protein
MQASESLREQMIHNLNDAMERLNRDCERVAFWAAALDAFVKPIPTYEATHSEYLLGAADQPQNRA